MFNIFGLSVCKWIPNHHAIEVINHVIRSQYRISVIIMRLRRPNLINVTLIIFLMNYGLSFIFHMIKINLNVIYFYRLEWLWYVMMNDKWERCMSHKLEHFYKMISKPRVKRTKPSSIEEQVWKFFELLRYPKVQKKIILK